nr:xylulose kinase-1 [Tanacetum cinerariifolium]
MSDHEDETITAENAPPKNIPQITIVTNISAKFPYLKKGEYDIWAMKMQNFIFKEHQQVQKEEKARTILLSALPDEHMGDFYHMIDARDIWNAIKARFGGLKYISFDDLYNKLKFLEINTKGYSSSSSTLSNAVFGSSKSKCSVVDDVIYSFFANHEIDQQLVYVDLDQMNKDEFEEYDLKHQMVMLSNKKYKSKEVGKDGSDSKAMVVVDGSIDWDKQTEKGNTDPRSLENFGMLAGIKLESDADSEGEVVSADDVIPAAVFVSAGPVATAAVVYSLRPNLHSWVFLLREQLNDCVVDLKAHKNAVKSLEKQIKCHQTNQLAYEEKIRVLSYELEEKSNILEYRQKLIDQATQEKHDLMTKLDNELANQAKWNNSDKNLYKLIDSSMSVRTKRGLRLDKYIREGELGIDDSVFSIFYTTSDDLEGQPIYNRFASVDNMKAVPPSLTGNYMPPSNIPDIDESQMVYRKKATDSSKIKTNDDSISYFHDSVLFYFSDSYLHLIKDCDFHEQTFAKRNAEGKGKLGKRPTWKPVNPNRPYPIFVGSPNPVYAGQPNPASAGNGILGPRPLNIQSTSTYFHSFTHNNQQIIFLITHNLLYSLYKTGALNGKTVVKPSACWPWTKSSISTIKRSKINGGSKSKSWSFAKGPLGRPKSEMTWLFTSHKRCDLHEQRFTKKNTEGNGILKSRPTRKPVYPNRPKPAGRTKPVSAGRPNSVSADQPNPVSADQPNSVSADGDGILGTQLQNIQPRNTYFHSFTHNNQQTFFLITHNSLYSLYLTGGLNGKTVVKPSAGWPWTKYGMSKTNGSKINGGSKSKSWSYAKGPLGRPKSEMTWVPKEN